MSEELLWLAVLAHAHWQRGTAAQAQEGDGEFRGMERGSAGEFEDGQAYSSVLAGVQWWS